MHQPLSPPGAASMAISPVSAIYAARAMRDFGDGFVAVLLPVYLSAIGLDAFEIGVVATTALLGSASMTLAIGFVGHRIDQRTLLILASALMVATGLAFTRSASFGAVLLVAFCGTVKPSSGSVSIFVPLEHAVLSHLVADKARTSAFGRYSLVGGLAAALGALAAMSPELLGNLGISRLRALEGMFALYAMLGIVGGLFYVRIPRAAANAEEKPRTALGPSRCIVYRLAALFCIDAFAGGLAVQSLVALCCSPASACPCRWPGCSSSPRGSCRPSPSRWQRGCRGASVS